MKKHIWAICFTAALIAFTVFLALDTFVLSTVYIENATEMNMALFSELEETQDASAEVAEEPAGESVDATSVSAASLDFCDCMHYN